MTKLKSLLLILLSLLMTVNVDAEEVYRVYSVVGNVYMVKPTGRTLVSRRETVVLSTVLQLSEGAKLQLLAPWSGRLYVTDKAGKYTVKEIIRYADSDASALISKANKRIRESMRSSAQSHTRFQNTGVVMHATDAVNSDSLSLIQLFQHPERSDQTDVVLLRREHNSSDGTFNFAVFNTLDHPVYVNIINSPTEPIRFLFPDNVLVAPRCETNISQFVFSLSESANSFALISSCKDFSSDDVCGLLTTARPDFHLSLLTVGP